MDSLTPDLDGTMCLVTTCLEVADGLGWEDLQINDLVGVPEAERVVRLDLPLCGDHRHLLRMTPTLIAFSSGPDD